MRAVRDHSPVVTWRGGLPLASWTTTADTPRGGNAIDQAIGILVLVAWPVAGDVDATVADFERQVRNRRIEVEQPRHVGLGFERDVPEIIAGHDELPGAGAIIEAHGMGHPVIDFASALVAKQ